MNPRNGLEDEIKRISEKLNELEPGSDEYEELSVLFHKYVDRCIELEKLDYDVDEKALAREESNELKTQQLNEAKKDRISKNVISGVGIAVSIAFGVGAFIFDSNGKIFSSTFGRDHIKSLIHFRK